MARLSRALPVLGIAMLGWVGTAQPVAAASIAIDALTDAFPPNPCLPASSQQVIFTGSFCDGASCPPGTVVSGCGGSGFSEQIGLAGVLGGVARAADLRIYGNDVSARIVPSSQQIDVSLPPGNGVDGLSVNYSSDGADWALDLYGMGVSAIRVPVSGVITPSHPLIVRVVMSDFGDDVLLGGYAEFDAHATAAGDVVIPLSAFTVGYDFDFRSVDAISFSVSECGSSSCIGADLPARQFSIGPFTMDTGGATASRSPSWGRLKVRYR